MARMGKQAAANLAKAKAHIAVGGDKYSWNKPTRTNQTTTSRKSPARLSSIPIKNITPKKNITYRNPSTKRTIMPGRSLGKIITPKNITVNRTTIPQKIITLSQKRVLINKRIAETARKNMQQMQKRKRESLSFQSNGRLILRRPSDFARAVNRKTGATSFTSAVPIIRTNRGLLVQDFNFRFNKKGNLIYVKKTGQAILNESHFLQRDMARRNRLLEEVKF